ncbi:glycoside hydrolase [Rhodobacter phage RcTiptonus]|nr:glycoside hydrolase [Rhodobacter phage RcTiptonus]
MSIAYIQGFELIEPPLNYQPGGFGMEDLGWVTQMTISCGDDTVAPADWYVGVAGTNDTGSSGVFVQASGARISGQCLAFKRPHAGEHNATFNGSLNVMTTVELAATECVNFGFGVRYDARPLRAIPVLRFSYDNGVTDTEQAVMWIGRNGNIFFASSAFDFEETEPHNPVPIEEATTVTGAFVFTRWHFIEISITLVADEQSVLSISVDGVPLMEFEPIPELMRAPRPLINRVGIINPMNTYFEGGYTMFVDDVYVGNDLGTQNTSLLGQQHIVRLSLGAASLTQWEPVGEAENALCVSKRLGDPENYDSYVQATSHNKFDVYEFGELGAMFTTVNAVRILSEQSIATGTGTLTLRAIDAVNGNYTMNVLTPIPDQNGTYLGNALFEAFGSRDLTIANVNAAMFGYGS